MTSADLDKAINPPALGDLPVLPEPIPADTKYLLHRNNKCVKIEHLVLDTLLDLFKVNRDSTVVDAGATSCSINFGRQLVRAVVLASVHSTGNQLVAGIVTHVDLNGFKFEFQAPIPTTGVTKLSWKVFSL